MSESALRLVEKLPTAEALNSETLEQVIEAIKNEETKENVIAAFNRCGPQVIAKRLLSGGDNSSCGPPPELQVDLLAECLKNDEFRSQAAEESIVKRLVQCLTKDGELDDTSCAHVELIETNPTTVKHIFRALSNICYENDEAQNIVCDHKGVELIGTFLSPILRNSKSGSDGGKPKADESILICLLGCLFNVARKENCLAQIRELELVTQIVDALPHLPEAAATHAVNLLFNATEIAEFQTDLLAATPSLIRALAQQGDKSDDVLEVQVELLQTLFSEVSDEEKLKMYESGLWIALKDLAEKRVLKSAIDAIIVLLTDDECMKRMFDDGRGAAYQLLKTWLKNDSEDLRICAALAMGNFARGDAQCVTLINDSVGLQLVSMISPSAGTNQNYAVLSALRNMLIPKECKSRLMDAGLLEKLTSLLPIENYTVAFKFLGCLRMSADRQPAVAERLGSDAGLIKSVVQFAQVELHEGVRSEAMRVLCWILKNTQADSVCRTIATEGGFETIVGMLKSEHSVMKNEAIISLSLLLHERGPEVVFKVASKNLSAMSQNLAELLGSEDLASEVLENAVTLVICTSKLRNEFRVAFIPTISEPLQRLEDRAERILLKHKCRKALQILKE